MATAPIALISVSDKSGIIEFALGLSACGWRILSTGGTARLLASAGVSVDTVDAITEFPEILDGRVKTLHPAVHAGLLARRDRTEHMETLIRHKIAPIDLICVNLYPFAETAKRANVDLDEVIENIDIGGPAMLRSAAKNHASVTVVVHPEDYAKVLAEIADQGSTTLATRRRLASRAFRHTAMYDSIIGDYLGSRFDPYTRFPDELTLGLSRSMICRYGENAHQAAALYLEPLSGEASAANATKVHGKDLSFNNLYDLNAALETVKEFCGQADEDMNQPAAVIIKHANPCGAALADTIGEAFLRAREADPVSAFGGILALNRPLDLQAAQLITGKGCFFEAIIAPDYHQDALPVLTDSKKWGADLRLLVCGDLEDGRDSDALDVKKIVGGLLVQTRDLLELDTGALLCVTDRKPTTAELAELQFAWRVVKHVRSNAIVLTRDRRVVGIGAGQMNRVQSVRLATNQAGAAARGAVMASDAFFPFPDGPEEAAKAGITAIIQPGGSKKDADTVEICNQYAVAMVYTAVRHFLH